MSNFVPYGFYSYYDYSKLVFIYTVGTIKGMTSQKPTVFSPQTPENGLFCWYGLFTVSDSA